MGAVDEGFGEIELSSNIEVARYCLQNLRENPFLLPLLKAPMTGLVRRISTGQVGPGRASPQDPEDAV